MDRSSPSLNEMSPSVNRVDAPKNKKCRRWHLILLILVFLGVGCPLTFLIYANQHVLHELQHEPWDTHRVDPNEVHLGSTGCGGNLTLPQGVTDVRVTGGYGNFTYAPFFHRAQRSPNAEDITLVVQTSADRLDRAVSIARIWDGAISVALFVRSTEKDLEILEGVMSRSRHLQVQRAFLYWYV